MAETRLGIIAQLNSSWCTRVHREDLVTFHVDGTLGSPIWGIEARSKAAGWMSRTWKSDR